MSTFNTFAPALESLDQRALMSCTVGAVGNHLTITGDGADDQVTIRDNGRGGVTVVATGAGTKSFTGIEKITINTEDGNDTVTYSMYGSLVGKQYVLVGLGSTNGVNGGGDDTFRATVMDGVDILGRLDFVVDGGGGNDVLSVKAVGVDVPGILKSHVVGNTGRDQIEQSYDGEADGSMTMRAFGGSEYDNIWESLNFAAGSTGITAGWVEGDGGDDTLALFMFTQPGMTIVKADLIGGDGLDTFMSTPNVNVVQ